ncbi:MAG: outer membrane lipoprotein carrier protein LolA [Hyphomicrobiales bacterium]
MKASLTKFVRLGVTAAYLALVGAIAFNATPSFAAASGDLSASDSAGVDKISQFFNAFKTMQGEFVQVGPRGDVSKGTFHISKPGKLRFDYKKPNPFLIVSDGTWVEIRNRKNNRADHYPLAATPLKLILSDNVDLRKHARILKVAHDGDAIILTLADKNKAVPGKLTLIYSESENKLKEWVVVDGENRRTSISLVSMTPGGEFNSKLFKVKKRKKKYNDDSK